MSDGAQGKFFVTNYAVDRYMERIRKTIPRDQALREMINLTTAAHRVGPYIGRGLTSRYPNNTLELWRGPRVGTKRDRFPHSKLRFVVGYGIGDLPQVITVLPHKHEDGWEP